MMAIASAQKPLAAGVSRREGTVLLRARIDANSTTGAGPGDGGVRSARHEARPLDRNSWVCRTVRLVRLDGGVPGRRRLHRLSLRLEPGAGRGVRLQPWGEGRGGDLLSLDPSARTLRDSR